MSVVQSTKTNHLPWQETLQTGDVVAFCFPHEKDGRNKPKIRPVLVLDVEETPVGRFAVLAYGTSSPRPRQAIYCINVHTREDRKSASLDRPTSFNAARRIKVSVNHSGFDVNSRTGTPVLGRLVGSAKDRMQRVRARVDAERSKHRDHVRRVRRGPGVVRSRPEKPNAFALGIAREVIDV